MTRILKSAMMAATAAVSLAAVVPAMAADNTVLTVDLNQIYANSAAGKSGNAQLNAKYQGMLSAQQNAYNAAARSYQSDVDAARKALKPGAQPPQATLTQIQQAGERAQQAQDQLGQTREEAQQAVGYVRQQIIEHVVPLAEQIRAERKASVVLPKDGLLASDPADDITSTVIQRLDSSFPTPSITPPADNAAAAAAAPAATAPAPATGRHPRGR